MKAIHYIGTKPKLNPETLLHKAKVTKLKRELWKVQVDIENGCYEHQEQVLPKDFIGSHQKRSLWSKVKHLLEQLLP